MSEHSILTKAALIAAIERNWTALTNALDRLNEDQMTMLKDTQGWTIKDHVIHLAAWERSALFFLQGKPRHEGLGVDEATYQQGDDSIINAAVQVQTKHTTLPDARLQLRIVHQQLIAALEPLTDSDLQQRYRHFLPDEPGEGDGPLAIKVVAGNSAEHFAEHLGWIATLVGAS